MTEAKENKEKLERKPVKKYKQGVVVSNKMNKTVVVAVSTKVKHKQYGKFIKRTQKFFAHDAKNLCGEGDTVQIMEVRPLSKNKTWVVKEIVSKAIGE